VRWLLSVPGALLLGPLIVAHGAPAAEGRPDIVSEHPLDCPPPLGSASVRSRGWHRGDYQAFPSRLS
jgi:hypothetical protein